MEASIFDKSLKNPKRKTQILQSQQTNRQFNHRPVAHSGSIRDQNFAPPILSPLVQQLEMMHGQKNGGVFLNPRPPFSLSSSLPPNYRQQQPPLLPLPVVSKPAFLSLPPPPPCQLSVSPPAHSRKQRKQQQQQKAAGKKDDVVKVSNKKKPSGPDPGSLPKEVTTRILLTDHTNGNEDDDIQKMTSAGSNYSVYSLSAPPPSSLPLPKFSLLRQHLKPQQPRLVSCTVEAAASGEIDDGATDNLCRLLRLR